MRTLRIWLIDIYYPAGLLGVLTVLRAIRRQDTGALRAEALQAVVLKALTALGQRRQHFTGVLRLSESHATPTYN